MEHPNGDIFQGQYKAGLKEGEGSYLWNNGPTYHGKWENDEMEGMGRLICKDKTYDCKFSKGKLLEKIEIG